MTYTGHMKLHFNRHNAAPLVWCVSTDEWEIAVGGVVCAAPMTSVYAPKAEADEDDGRPSAWFDVYGRLELRGSVAYIAEAP